MERVNGNIEVKTLTENCSEKEVLRNKGGVRGGLGSFTDHVAMQRIPMPSLDWCS